jgi:hypothetical protein
MAYRWPTDPKGKAPSHSIAWDAHQANLKAKNTPAPVVPPSTPEAPQPMFDPSAPLPVDATYDSEMGALGMTRDQGLAAATGERTRGLAEYGFTESAFDPNTQTMGALAFDPNNPFSKAALLKKSYDTGRARTGQSMASQGQLYSGAYQNSQDLLNRNQLQGEDALTKSLSQFLAGNSGQRTQAQTGYEMGAGQAEGDRVGRALSNPLYSPVIGATNGVSPAAGAAPAGPPKKGVDRLPPRKGVDRIPKPLTIKAGPHVKATKNTTVTKPKKGRTVTYTTSVKGP